MLHDILSSQVQVSLKPPVHFSNRNEQRGTITKLPVVVRVGAPNAGVPNPGTPTVVVGVVRSVIVAVAMCELLSCAGVSAGLPEARCLEARWSSFPQCGEIKTCLPRHGNAIFLGYLRH